MKIALLTLSKGKKKGNLKIKRKKKHVHVCMQYGNNIPAIS